MAQRYQGGILGVGFNPLQAPNAPTIGTASVASETSISVAFTAPANVGGSAISSYRVLANPGGIGATTSSSPVTVSGLTNGTTYTFSVAAVNSYGFSPYSGTATATPAISVEDVFSTWLYTGAGTTQTITNGIDLAGNGGLVWLKRRSATQSHGLFDTSRGENPYLSTDNTSAQLNFSNGVVFNSNGFTNKATSYFGGSGDGSGTNYASWTFREAPKFFDIVTYTGDGSFKRVLNHSLGVAPGFIVVKRTDSTSEWWTWHRGGSGAFKSGYLNLTDAFNESGYVSEGSILFGENPAVVFDVFNAGGGNDLNVNGATYVAYLYAHNTASDGIIQCGSYTGNGSATGPIVTLGWEPQWLMIKNASGSGRNWLLFDNMRGMAVGSEDAYLVPNATAAEASFNYLSPTATGFQITATDGSVNNNGQTFIYMAIRRGPMKTPTVGTTVFSPVAAAGSQGTNLTTSFPVDMQIQNIRTGAGFNTGVVDRLRLVNTTTSGGVASGKLTTTNTTQENGVDSTQGWNNTGFSISQVLGVSTSVIYWNFRRAPSFFDEVCYTGTSVARTLNHNLGVAPELMIVKVRNSGSYGWYVYAAPQGATKAGRLDLTGAFDTSSVWNNTAPTASVFSLSDTALVNGSFNYVAYLFASCPGVSKVGTYTGTGALQTINCAFTTGARFVLIKRTDSTGDWFVWDSARGISSGNDPYSLLNSTAAETTGTNYVDTDTTGFKVTAAAPAGINAVGGTYIFLAIS